MTAALPRTSLHWTTSTPPAGLVALAAVWGRDLPRVLVGLLALVLAGAVLAAVHHAEVVAHRVDEPGRATRLQGSTHLVLLAAFLFLAVSP